MARTRRAVAAELRYRGPADGDPPAEPAVLLRSRSADSAASDRSADGAGIAAGPGPASAPRPLVKRPSKTIIDFGEDDDDGEPAGARPAPDWPLWRLFLACAAFRLANALLLRTYFNPDEYWQGPEVAHGWVFGGGAPTWEWRAGLRGALHPGVFALLFRLLAALGLDSRWAIAYGPRMLMAVAAAAGDVASRALAARFFGRRAGRAALACSLGSWFLAFTAVRTFSSSLESPLVAWALVLWPWSYLPRLSPPPYPTTAPLTSRQAALCLAFAAVAVRPTAAALFLPLGIAELISACRGRPVPAAARALWTLVMHDVIPAAAAWAVAGLAADRAAYGRWVFTPWEFLQFNLFRGGGARYGTHPGHWYLSQGLPTVLATFLPLFVLGLWVTGRAGVGLIGFVAWGLLALSASAHKELRFLLPLMAPALAIAGAGLASLSRSGGGTVGHGTVGHAGAGAGGRGVGRWAAWAAAGAAFAPQAALAAYFCFVHQSGAEGVMAVLASEAAAGRLHSGGVLFLTPCHATPYRSFLHVTPPPVMRYLDCSPPEWRPGSRGGQGSLGSLGSLGSPGPGPAPKTASSSNSLPGEPPSEEAWALGSPLDFLRSDYGFLIDPACARDSSPRVGTGTGAGCRPKRGTVDFGRLPSHVVTFDDTAVRARPFLAAAGYAPRGDLFNTLFADDRGTRVVVYARREGGPDDERAAGRGRWAGWLGFGGRG